MNGKVQKEQTLKVCEYFIYLFMKIGSKFVGNCKECLSFSNHNSKQYAKVWIF